MKPLVLIILDGWGIAPPGPGNAISQISTHNIEFYSNTYPHTELHAAGVSVGLPEKEAGNSETGHINIGAGRIVDQDLTRINRSISDGSFYENQAFLDAIKHSKNNNSNLHIMGLLSDEGVHASVGHLIALLTLMDKQKFDSVYVHLFTDGRDSPPKSSIEIYSQLAQQNSILKKYPIATVMGRYFSMDRDNRLERTDMAYKALTDTTEYTATSFEEAVTLAYERLEADEFIKPTIITNQPRIQSKDSVIFFNYRIDRTKQLTKAFMMRMPEVYFVSMTEYETGMNCHAAYTPLTIQNTLGETLSKLGLRQLHAAESEKERFVTYYFNGMHEEPFQGEERVIIPSPKVATYDLAPEMSSIELASCVMEKIPRYDFVVMNFANPDMVGHSGIIKAAIQACETVDIQVKRIVEAVLAQHGTAIITADHGHAEEMKSSDGQVLTEHTRNPVPFIVCNPTYKDKNITLQRGVLGDIAPTILFLLNLEIPTMMTGRNLLSL